MVECETLRAWMPFRLPHLILVCPISTPLVRRQTEDPPQKPLVYRLTLEDFNRTLNIYVSARRAVYAAGLKPKLADATFENTVQVMADFSTDASLILAPLYIQPSPGETQELRQGATKVFIRAEDMFCNSTADTNLYTRVEKVYKHFEQDDKLDTTGTP